MNPFFAITALAILAACIPTPASAAAQPFETWLGVLRSEARRNGISDTTLVTALPQGMQPLETVLRLDRKQPEKTRTQQEYLRDVVNAARIERGRTRYLQNRHKLEKIAKKYGVDPQFIVALWGIETNYGQNTGGFDVVNALATLAYDGRRGDYFRQELLGALKIIDGGHITHDKMKGSWAGAMGQVQFMPTSFFNFAEDYNNDGRADIWTDLDDVFASAANYLHKSGWQYGQPWGLAVTLPDTLDPQLIGGGIKKPLAFWNAQGLRTLEGKAIPFQGSAEGALIQPDGAGGQAYIVYENYNVIMKWNRSSYFATAVGTLADNLGNYAKTIKK